MKCYRQLLAALLGAVCTAAFAGSMTAAAVSADEEKKRQDSVEIFCSMCNDARVEAGLRELYIAPVLVDYAQIRAQELTTLFSHSRPDGTKCFTVMKNEGFFYNTAAENIAAGGEDAVETFYQFMNSSGHRQNIMTEAMTHIGTGFVEDMAATPEPDLIDYRYYWSMFLIGAYDAHDTPVTYPGQYIPVREPGDADGSKTIDAADAIRILRYSAARSSGSDPRVTDAFLKAADVNGDSAVNAIDAQIVLAYCAAAGTNPDAVLQDFVW